MKHALCSNISWIDGNSAFPKIEVGLMTLISAYRPLFIRGEKSGGNVRGKCP